MCLIASSFRSTPGILILHQARLNPGKSKAWRAWQSDVRRASLVTRVDPALEEICRACRACDIERDGTAILIPGDVESQEPAALPLAIHDRSEALEQIRSVAEVPPIAVGQPFDRFGL